MPAPVKYRLKGTGLAALVLSLILFLSLAVPVAAGTLEDATAAFARGDYATALPLLRPLADQGDAQAQAVLGFMYDGGLGVARDYREAAKWYRKAADQGHAEAQFNLGAMYRDGLGVAKDYGEAVKWYHKAADQGYARAQAILGDMYTEGWGVKQDDAEAAKWYRKAADQGDAHAQNNLGVMYENGRGVAQDYVQAHKWFNLAAARYPASQSARAVKNRDRVAAQMTPAQIEEAQRLAREWKPMVIDRLIPLETRSDREQEKESEPKYLSMRTPIPPF